MLDTAELIAAIRYELDRTVAEGREVPKLPRIDDMIHACNDPYDALWATLTYMQIASEYRVRPGTRLAQLVA